MLGAVSFDLLQRSSHVKYVNVPGRTDDLAEAIGSDPSTGAPPSEVREEVKMVMDGMKSRLETVGMKMDDLVSVQVFCPDLTSMKLPMKSTEPTSESTTRPGPSLAPAHFCAGVHLRSWESRSNSKFEFWYFGFGTWISSAPESSKPMHDQVP